MSNYSYNVEAILSAKDQGFSAVLNSAAASAGRLSRSVGKSFTSGLKRASKAAGVSIAALGTYAVKAGADFEAAMSQVASVADFDLFGSAEDQKAFQQLTEKAKELGRTTKFSATEAAQGLQYMAQAGWDTDRMLQSLPGLMNLAAASGEDLALTAGIVTSGMQAFGLQAADTGRFVDVLAKAAAASNSDVSGMGESFKYAAPIAGTLGYSIEDTALALSLMADNGIQASQAGTTLRGALTALASPTSEAAALMDDLGISITNSDGTMKDFRTVMGDMRKSMKGLTREQQVQAATTIFGRQAMSGMLAIINASDEEFGSLAEAIDNSAGSAERMAEIMNDNLKGSLTILRSAMEGLGIELFRSMEGLKPVVKSVTELIGSMTERLQDFNDVFTDPAASPVEKMRAFREMMEPLIPLASTLGAALATALALPGISAAAQGIALLTTGLLGGGHAAGLFGKAIQAALALLGPTAVAGVALAGLGLLNEKFGESISGMLETAKEKGPEIIQSLSDGIASRVGDLIDQGASLLSDFLSAFTENVPAIMEAGRTIIGNLIDGVVENLPGLIDEGAALVSSLAEEIGTSGALLIDKGADLIGALVDGISENLDTLIPAAIDMIGSIVTGLLENLPDIIESGFTLILALAQGIAENLPMMIERAGQAIGSFISGLVTKIPSLITKGGEIILALLRGLAAGLQSLVLMGWDLIKNLIQGLKDGWDGKIGELWEKITGWFSGLGEKISGFFGDIWAKVTGKTREGADEMILAYNEVGESLITATEGITDSVTLNFNALPEAIQDALYGVNLTAQEKLALFQTIMGEGTDLSDVVLSVNGHTRSIEDFIGGMSAHASESVGGLDETLLQSAENINGYVSNVNTDMDQAETKADTVYTGTQEMFNEGLDTGPFTESAETGGTQAVQSLKDASQTAREDWQAGYDGMGETATAGHSEQLADLENFTAAEQSELDSHWDALREKYQTSADEQVEVTKTAQTDMHEETQTGQDHIAETNEEAQRAREESLSSHYQTQQNATQENWDTVESTTQAGLDATQSNLDAGFSAAVESAETANEGIQTAFSGLADATTEIGTQAGLGLNSGLWGTAETLYGTARTIANNIAATLRSALQVRSPSRVTAEIGAYTGEGLEVGLARSERGILRTASGIAASMISELRGSGRNRGLRDLSGSAFRGGSFAAGSPALQGAEAYDGSSQPMQIHLVLGGRDYKAFVADISEAQDREVRLEAYHV